MGTGAHTMQMNIKKRKVTAAAARSLPRPHSEYLRDETSREPEDAAGLSANAET